MAHSHTRKRLHSIVSEYRDSFQQVLRDFWLSEKVMRKNCFVLAEEVIRKRKETLKEETESSRKRNLDFLDILLFAKVSFLAPTL